MQFSSFLLLILFSVVTSAHTSLRDSCGVGTVTNERTVTSQNYDIKITTSSCPGFAALKNTSAPTTRSASKRQVIAGSCDGFVCDTSVVQPNIFDCNHLAEALTGFGTEQFSAPSETLTTFSLATCLFGFANLDVIPYIVSFSNVGLAGDSVVSFCANNNLPSLTFTAGFCLSPGIEGDDWIIEVMDA